MHPALVQQLRHGDVLWLRNGVHTCAEDLSLRRGVIVRGECKAGAIVRGTSGGASPFRGCVARGGRFGATAIESLTIESAQSRALLVHSGGRAAVTDVDMRGLAGPPRSTTTGWTPALPRRARHHAERRDLHRRGARPGDDPGAYRITGPNTIRF